MDVARWFAGRGAYGPAGLQAPTVYRIEVDPSEVLARLTSRSEDEYILDLRGQEARLELHESVARDAFERVEEQRRL